ncbi:hypothetical protein JXQ70_18780 [bacterium]|nr:hypothetical protein [bacterium]
MIPRFLAPDDQTTVVFLCWQSLPYRQRFVISICLILIGFVVQIGLYSATGLILGLLFIIAGNCLLLVRGYTNALKFEAYNPAEVWEKVDQATFRRLRDLHQAMKKWDRSPLDITNQSGGLIFFGILLASAALFITSLLTQSFALLIIGLDTICLLLPHWFTGTRRIATQTGLLEKIEIFEDMLDHSQARIKKHSIEFLMLLQGKDSQKLPRDVKFRVDISGQKQDFLGLYGQLVMNLVQGKSYPYFYTVVVMKPDKVALLKKQTDPVIGVENDQFWDEDVPEWLKKLGVAPLSDDIILEYKEMDDVRVLVVRQFTTSSSGYHTTSATRQLILETGLRFAEKIAPLG